MNTFRINKRIRSSLYHNNSVPKTKITDTLTPRTLLWSQCTHGSYVAHGTHHTPRRHLRYLNIFLLPWHKGLPSVCSQVETASFTSTSFANLLPARRFLRGQNGCKSLGDRSEPWGSYSVTSQSSYLNHSQRRLAVLGQVSLWAMYELCTIQIAFRVTFMDSIPLCSGSHINTSLSSSTTLSYFF